MATTTLSSADTSSSSAAGALLAAIQSLNVAASAPATIVSTTAPTTTTTSTTTTVSAPTSAPTTPVVTAPSPQPALPPTVTVNSAAGLAAALKTAGPGETIKLAAGDYSSVVLSNLHFTEAVTITSADPLHAARFVGLNVAGSSGLTFNNVAITTGATTDPYFAFRVSNSQNIAFDHVDAHGDPTLAPGSQASGFLVSGSSGVSITNSTLHDLNAAISVSNSQGLAISNNTFSHLSKGGVEMGGASNVAIDGNTFKDFVVSAGVHPDAIQVFTTDSTLQAHDISITNNLIDRGFGDPVQGIFIRDETGHLPYTNLTIANNSVIGGMWNSVYVNAAVNGTLNVSHNLVTSWAGVNTVGDSTSTALASTANYTGIITLAGDFSGAQLTETGNTAQGYVVNGVTGAPAGNTQVGAISAVSNLQDLHTAVVAAATSVSVLEHGMAAGDALIGSSGGLLYLADVGAGTKPQQAVGSSLTLAGLYGNLTVHADGSFSYVESANGLTIGQTYVDHFTTTVANESGQASPSTLDILVHGTGMGDGGSDLIVGGSTAAVMSGFGAHSKLVSGAGQDTYQFDSIAQSTPTAQTEIKGYKAGDIIDLHNVDPDFHLVQKFTGHAHELVAQQLTGGAWELYGDTTGSGHADFQIYLSWTTAPLSAGSFHF